MPRNRIYESVFGLQWVKQHIPIDFQKWLAYGLAAALLLALVGALGLWLRPAYYPAGDGSLLGRPLRVGIVTWPGYAGGIVANNGFKPNKDCIYWTKYGQMVEFILMEDVDVRNKAFAKGGENGVDIVWSSVDFWANELPTFDKAGVKARAIMQVDWSRGGDAIVVGPGIDKIEDLKGKKISLAQFTPSHWLLEYSLGNSGLGEAEQAEIYKNIVFKTASPDARADFVAHKVDAAVLWEPDITAALSERPGSKVLLSTREAANLLADIMVAREDFIREHPDIVKAFIQGWMDGTQEANRNPDKVVRLLMENEPVYVELGEKGTRASLTDVKWADLGDNALLFGLDGSEPLFDRIFKSANRAWLMRGYINSDVSPEQARDASLLKEIYDRAPVEPASGTTLPAAGREVEKMQAVMTKPINIYFPYGGSTLDPDSQQMLDQVATLVQTFSGAYIRIEGNTDSLGASSLNRDLSLLRAQAVADFLVQRYHLNRNRFIVVGNGPDKPLRSNATPEGRAANRRIDVEIVPVK